MDMTDDTKIYLVTFRDVNLKLCVSHGAGNNSLRNYCLPQETIESFNPKRDSIGYYVPC